MEGMTRLKELGRYLGYKLRQKIFVITIGLCSIPAILLFSLPLTARLVYAAVALGLGMVAIISAVDLLVGSAAQSIQISLYNRKHKPRKVFIPQVKEMAQKIGLKNYDKPINITDNPAVNGPFANPASGEITLPSGFQRKFKLHSTEVHATLGHELGHLKTRNILVREMLLVIVGTMAFTLLLEFVTLPSICILAEFAIMMLLLTRVLRRNEFRADAEGAKATSPEALIAVFESLESAYDKDEGSDTHPSIRERIERLLRLMESDKKE
jgi:Zn-dependent protease with chaperone function